MKILVIDGANLNMLGVFDPASFGSDTMDSIVTELKAHAETVGVKLDHFQSNYEGAIIDKLQAAGGVYDGVVMNPGSFGHYSYGMKEAAGMLKIPCIEVHLANIHRNPNNAPKIAGVCTGVVCGLGKYSYMAAIDAIVRMA